MKEYNIKNNQLRDITIQPNVLLHADGSCLIKCGNTHVICSANLDESVPRFLKNTKSGWLSAEYSMLPSSTNTRIRRDSARNMTSGRTMEIQRLIGRSLRSALDLQALGERQILIDTDVINADGGTRTASITGGYVALHLAIRSLLKKGILKTNPLLFQISAISCGILNGKAVLDMNYLEDSAADVDANFVFNNKGNIIEIQATGENRAFSNEELLQMIKASSDATNKLFDLQTEVLLK